MGMSTAIPTRKFQNPICQGELSGGGGWEGVENRKKRDRQTYCDY